MTPKLPLFLSRQDFADGVARAITRENARLIVRGVFLRAGIEDDGRLGSYSFRKSWAQSVYLGSDRDILVVKAALGHADIGTTQAYLAASESAVEAAMAKVDFTRPTRRERILRASFAPGLKDLSEKSKLIGTNRRSPSGGVDDASVEAAFSAEIQGTVEKICCPRRRPTAALP